MIVGSTQYSTVQYSTVMVSVVWHHSNPVSFTQVKPESIPTGCQLFEITKAEGRLLHVGSTREKFSAIDKTAGRAQDNIDIVAKQTPVQHTLAQVTWLATLRLFDSFNIQY